MSPNCHSLNPTMSEKVKTNSVSQTVKLKVKQGCKPQTLLIEPINDSNRFLFTPPHKRQVQDNCKRRKHY